MRGAWAALVEAITGDPVLRDIPIVMMGSLPEASVADRCSGDVMFVRKPSRIVDLVDELWVDLLMDAPRQRSSFNPVANRRTCRTQAIAWTAKP